MIVCIIVQCLACFLVCPHRFHLFLLLLAQLVVSNAFLQNQGSSFQGIVRHQIAIGYRLIQFVGKGVSRIHLEQVEGVLLHFFPWGSGQPYQQPVEVIEDSGIFTEYRTVGLINDNQVEATNGERFLLTVYVVYHRLIGTEQDACVHVRLPFITEDASAFVGKQLGIVLGCLTYQRSTVGQEQNILHPIVPLQHFGQRDGYTGLSCTCRHHQEGTAMLLVESFAHRTDGTFLIFPIGYSVIDSKVGNVCPSSSLNE